MMPIIPNYIATPIGDGYEDPMYIWGNHTGGGWGNGEWSPDGSGRGWVIENVHHGKYQDKRIDTVS